MKKNSKKKKKSNMLIPTIIMAVIAIILFFIAMNKGCGEHIAGLKSAYQMTIEVLPLLLLAFIVAGLVQSLIPSDLLSKWVGKEAGFKGIILGTIAGAITPGGPYVSLPIVAVLYKTGASAGTLVAFLTSWSLWAVARLPMEIGILGWRLTLIRFISVFFFPPIAGLIANFISKFFKYI